MRYLSDFETGHPEVTAVPFWVIDLVPSRLSGRALAVFCKALSMVDSGSYDLGKLREACGLSDAQFNAVALEFASCGLSLEVQK